MALAAATMAWALNMGTTWATQACASCSTAPPRERGMSWPSARYVRSQKKGKEVVFATKEAGTALCLRYREVREACLLPGFSGATEEHRQLGDMVKLLRTVSGRYDQAARAATSY